MNSLIVFSVLLAAVYAQHPYNNGAYNPQQGNSAAAPVHYVNVGAQLQGDYKFGYNTGNGGSFREETRNPDGSVSGAYGYIDASGQQKVIRYTAGKDGFKAEGDDVPKAPPAPQPVAPQHHQGQYQPQPQVYNHNQQSYMQPPVPTYNQNNYIQHQQPSYNGYSQPQQPAYNGYSQPQHNSQGQYNPYAYITHQNSGAPVPLANPQAQLSYNIGTGGNQGYQG